MRIPVLRQQIRARREVGLSDRALPPRPGQPLHLSAVPASRRRWWRSPSRCDRAGASLAHRRAGGGAGGDHGALGVDGRRPGAGERRADGAAGRGRAPARWCSALALAVLLWVPPGAGRRLLRALEARRGPGVSWAAGVDGPARRCGRRPSGCRRGCSRRWPTLACSLALVLVADAASVASPARPERPVRAALALAAWQAVSPLLARALGLPWASQPGALAALRSTPPPSPPRRSSGRRCVRWTAVGGALRRRRAASRWAVGAAAPAAVALPGPRRSSALPVDRVHETFGGEDRFAAGGFFFHRLRLAHASDRRARARAGRRAPAAGPSPARRRRRALALACVVCIVLAYARAALLTAGSCVVLAALRAARGLGPVGSAGRLLVAVAGAALVSPGWRRPPRRGERELRRRRAGAGPPRRLGPGAAASVAGGGLRQLPAGGARPTDRHRHHRAALARRALHRAHRLGGDRGGGTRASGWPCRLSPGAGACSAGPGRATRSPLGALLSWVGYQTLGLAHYLPFHPSVALGFASSGAWAWCTRAGWPAAAPGSAQRRSGRRRGSAGRSAPR